MDTFRLTISQLNPIVGNFEENFIKVIKAWERGKKD